MKRKMIFTVSHCKHRCARENYTVIIDVDDWPRVKEYPWFYSPPRMGKRKEQDREAFIYTTVWRGGRTHQLKLQRFIMGDIPERMDVIHRDGNILNNQKKNLFVCETYNKRPVRSGG